MSDIIDLLIADHKEVKAMLKKLTADKEPDDADEIFDSLYTSLKKHAKFEESSVYPLLLDEGGEAKELALEAYEEHKQAITLLETLNDLQEDDETCSAKMKLLSENLNHHIKEEESELLPKLRKAVDAAMRTSLGEKYQAIKERSSPIPSRRKAPIHSR
jgi:hemerythrin superfamily protein